MSRQIILSFFLTSLISLSVSAKDTLRAKKVKILPVPTFGYSPETKTYVGAVALGTFDFYQNEQTRTSNASVEFTYTWRKQVLVEFDWNYFFNLENWFSKGIIHVSSYPDFLYQPGISSPDTKLSYGSERYLAEVYVLRKIGEKSFLGANLKVLSYQNINSLGAQAYDLTTAGIGVSYLLDSRDNILTPSKGSFLDVNLQTNQAEKTYQKLTLDVRRYLAHSNSGVLSLRYYQHFNFGSELPFFDSAIIGGDEFVRGFFYGRYYDKHASLLQAEYRTDVIWRLGLAVFGGLSTVYNNEQFIAYDDLKYNLGIGLRFLVDKKERTNLRIDVAIGEGGNGGFYFAFGESF